MGEQLSYDELQNKLNNVEKELKNSQQKITQLEKEVENLNNKNYSEALDQLILNQTKLNDYLIPTEEELEQQKKLQEEQQKEQEQLLLEQQQELEKEEQAQQTYQEEVLQQLKTINENTFNNEFQVKTSNGYFYILLLMLLLWFVCMFIYKLIKQFIH